MTGCPEGLLLALSFIYNNLLICYNLVLMSTRYPIETPLAIITGTHSAGKSTLLSDLEQGKLNDLGVYDEEYTDFGYGVIDSPTGKRALVTIPETARWYAGLYDRPDLLAENYNLDFQLSIDSLVIFRAHAATALSQAVKNKLIERGELPDASILEPIVVSDRGPLDGIIYSEARILDRDTNIVNGSPRTGFHTEWLKSFVDLVIIADHKDIASEADAARLDDDALRQKIGESTVRNYTQFMPEGMVHIVSGDQEARKAEVKKLLAPLTYDERITRKALAYEKWKNVKIA